MKKLAILVLALAIPVQAMALSTKDLLSLIAMPLAVAAVSDLGNVPQDQLAALVTSLNDANVPPNQFVQVLRYTPPALVIPATNSQPTLVQYVQTQTANGLTGPALVTAIDQQLPVYGVTPVYVDVPATTLVVQRDYIPTNVIAQLGGTADPLALVAMPLAVAAVSDFANVPQDQLANLVLSLNQAYVPAPQFIQVLRYAPVALVTVLPQQPTFVQFVQTQTANGLTGPALVTAINQQLPNYGLPPQVIYAPPPPPQTVVVDQNYFPPLVRTRVAEAEGNPHGGPPGQLKKIEGLQTGAEVVHGMKPGRQFGVNPGPPVIAEQPGFRGHHGNPHGMPPGQAKKIEGMPGPMISSAPERRIPPGHAKKMGGPPPAVMAPPVVVAPQAGPPAGVPPGQAKKEGGEKGGPPGGTPPGQAKGHGHGKD